MARAGIYDEAEIFNRDSCKMAQRELYVKLGVNLLYFFVFLYKCVGRPARAAHPAQHDGGHDWRRVDALQWPEKQHGCSAHPLTTPCRRASR